VGAVGMVAVAAVTVEAAAEAMGVSRFASSETFERASTSTVVGRAGID
jgi:hypothetical protein